MPGIIIIRILFTSIPISIPSYAIKWERPKPKWPSISMFLKKEQKTNNVILVAGSNAEEFN